MHGAPRVVRGTFDPLHVGQFRETRLRTFVLERGAFEQRSAVFEAHLSHDGGGTRHFVHRRSVVECGQPRQTAVDHPCEHDAGGGETRPGVEVGRFRFCPGVHQVIQVVQRVEEREMPRPVGHGVGRRSDREGKRAGVDQGLPQRLARRGRRAVRGRLRGLADGAQGGGEHVRQRTSCRIEGDLRHGRH